MFLISNCLHGQKLATFWYKESLWVFFVNLCFQPKNKKEWTSIFYRYANKSGWVWLSCGNKQRPKSQWLNKKKHRFQILKDIYESRAATFNRWLGLLRILMRPLPQSTSKGRKDLEIKHWRIIKYFQLNYFTFANI